MPVYTITDSKTGKSMDVRGDRPPTQDEAEGLFAQQPAPRPTGLASWLHPKPEFQAQATATEDAVNAEAQRNSTWPADAASRLPRALQQPAGVAFGLIEPAAESALALSGGLSALRNVKSMAPAFTGVKDVAEDALTRKLGINTTDRDLKTTKLDLQAARSRTRQARIQAQIDQANAPKPVSRADARAAAEASRQPPRLVLTPQEMQSQEQLTNALRPTARLEGMKSAARVKPGDLGVADALPESASGASAPVASPTLSPRLQRVLDQLPQQQRVAAQKLLAQGHSVQDVLALLQADSGPGATPVPRSTEQ